MWKPVWRQVRSGGSWAVPGWEVFGLAFFLLLVNALVSIPAIRQRARDILWGQSDADFFLALALFRLMALVALYAVAVNCW